MKILIVDDIEENLYLLKTILLNNGYKVLTAENGVEAIEKLKKESVDLIISDILMPKMDGFQLCRECKKDEKLRNIPLIFYTATYTKKSDEEFALSLGAAKFIVKPQDPDMIVKIIKKVIKEQSKVTFIAPKSNTNNEEVYLAGYNKVIVKKLEKKVMDLDKEIVRRKKIEINLNSRLNELDCLYRISDLMIVPRLPLEQIFKGIINIISSSTQYPEITCCRIVFNGQEFKTDNFKKTKWLHSENINVKDKKIGVIEVYYLKKKPDIYEGPFSKEESGLINSISKIINTVIEGKQAEDKQKESFIKLGKVLNSTINAMASIIEYKDPYTSGHQKRVELLAIAISEELDLSKNMIEAIGTAALVHDLGKINVPASILSKPGKISDIEFSMIKTHPQIGYEILKEIEFTYPIAKIIEQHHERLDGSGYPHGLKDKDILMEAKILGVADVVEAMNSHRPYRPAIGIDKALEEISKNKGKLYDAKVVDACLNIFSRGKFKF